MSAMEGVSAVGRTPSMPATANPVASDESLLPEPTSSASESAVFAQSLEALLALLQEAEGNLVAAKGEQAAVDDKDRNKHIAEAFKKIDEAAKARNSPGFFKAIFRVIKDFAADLLTDQGKLFSDLGKNLKEMVESPNFWSDLKKGCMAVVKVAAVVAAVAATVVTCGGAGPVLAAVVIALSAASLAESELHVMEKLGIDPKIAAGIQIALAVASMVTSLGATSAASTTQLVRAAQTVRQASSVVQAGTSVVGGAATIVDGGFEKAKLDGQADRKAIDNAIQQLEDEIKDIIEQIKQAKDDGSAISRAVQSVAGSQAQQFQIMMAMRA